MKRKCALFLIPFVIAAFALISPFYSSADDLSPELIKGFVTAYTGPTDTTYMGTKCRKGICGGCKEYLGKTIILYKRLPGDEIGEIIGIYECQDTGTGTKSFQEGKVIDVWQPDEESIQEFANLTWSDGCKGKVFIQIVEGKR